MHYYPVCDISVTSCEWLFRKCTPSTLHPKAKQRNNPQKSRTGCSRKNSACQTTEAQRGRNETNFCFIQTVTIMIVVRGIPLSLTILFPYVRFMSQNSENKFTQFIASISKWVFKDIDKNIDEFWNGCDMNYVNDNEFSVNFMSISNQMSIKWGFVMRHITDNELYAPLQGR